MYIFKIQFNRCENFYLGNVLYYLQFLQLWYLENTLGILYLL